MANQESVIQPEETRYQRYKKIVDDAVDREQFEIDEIKAACLSENPGFVTRVIRELEKTAGFFVKMQKRPPTGGIVAVERFALTSGWTK